MKKQTYTRPAITTVKLPEPVMVQQLSNVKDDKDESVWGGEGDKGDELDAKENWGNLWEDDPIEE